MGWLGKVGWPGGLTTLYMCLHYPSSVGTVIVFGFHYPDMATTPVYGVSGRIRYGHVLVARIVGGGGFIVVTNSFSTIGQL